MKTALKIWVTVLSLSLMTLASCSELSEPDTFNPPFNPPTPPGSSPAGSQVSCAIEPASVLGQTESGVLFHRNHCIASNANGKLIIFLPGTGQKATQQAPSYTACLGELTGLCTMSIPYENAGSIGACCSLTGIPDEAWEENCLRNTYFAKFNGGTARCVGGETYSVSFQESIREGTRKALDDLGLQSYKTNGNVDWTQIFLTGHSQGAALSAYFGIVEESLNGMGSLAGGAARVGSNGEFPWYVLPTVTPPLTDPARHRAFHHTADNGPNRQRTFLAMGLNSNNIRLTDDPSSECQTNAHACIISEPLLPQNEQGPVFLKDWLWMVFED